VSAAALKPSDVRATLLDMPDVGRVATVRVRGKRRIVLDFSPDLRGSSRYLWSFYGKAFASEAEAERVRGRIGDLMAPPRSLSLEDAIAEFRGIRSRVSKATTVVDQFLEEAPRIQSERTGRFLAPRTIHAYGAVLRRARPFFEGMTFAELCSAATLRRFKAWFRLPKDEGGRGLQSDQEARNAFAALRAVVSWYRLERPDFPKPDWPTMPTALRAKRENVAERNRERLTLGQVVRAIEEIPPESRAVFWVMFYCGARPTEAKAVLARDYARPLLEIRRSAATKHAGAEVRPMTKTAERGSYALPDFVCDLVDEHHAPRVRFNRDAPLLGRENRSGEYGLVSDDWLHDRWSEAVEAAEIPHVPLYRATKHTPFSALRLAGIPIESLQDLYRWTNAATAEHYDESKDERRAGAVVELDALVRKERGS